MFDLMFSNRGDIQFKNANDSLALNNQIALFCVCKEGELSYDRAYGLPYDLLLNEKINNKFKSNLIRAKIKIYFDYKIKKIESVVVTKKDRTLFFTIKYIDIYSEEVQTIEN